MVSWAKTISCGLYDPGLYYRKKKRYQRSDIGLLLNQNCLGSLTKIIFSPSAVSVGTYTLQSNTT